MMIRGFVLIPLHLCPGDLAGTSTTLPDGKVDIFDLLYVLAHWGVCPEPDEECPTGCCWADISSSAAVGVPDGVVDIFDLLLVLANDGVCHGHPDVPTTSIDEELTDVGISQQRWEDFLTVLENGTMSEQRRWICWFERRISRCETCRPCAGSDPFE